MAALLLLVRHARAEKQHLLGDRARALTAEGRVAFKRHAYKLKERVKLQGIVTSPLVRAVQTAEIMAETFGLARVEVRGELIPRWRAPQRIIELALELGPGWALVGHNPSLKEAAAGLLGLAELPRGLPKGAAIALKRQGKGFGFDFLARIKGPLETSLTLVDK